MGRRGGKNFRNRNGGGGRGGGGGGGKGRDTTNWAEVEKKNEAFENYYNDLFSEEEAKEMWTALRRELPNSFRFTGSKGHALTVQQHMIDRYIPTITSVTWNDQPVDPPRQLPWYPEKLAWAMTTPKQVVRRFAPFASFQKFLVSETTVGNISRQEVVSMIPPLFMDIKPGMAVLDLCAAPGSKTAQLLEMLHGGEEARVRKIVKNFAQQNGREASPDGVELQGGEAQADAEEDWSDDGRSTGLLIANDVDWKRAQLLIHQTKRLNSPNLIVTNHDARHYPSIMVDGERGKQAKYLKFDRILADVPCTGDGTARKNVNVWKDWTTANALNLHGLQALILLRALQMLKVGGRVVYSTCSMNPIENESVISSVIDRCGGPKAVEIIDCSDRFPDLIRRPGLSEWKVVDRAGRKWNSWTETVQGMKDLGEDNFGKLVEGMYPLETTEEDDKIPLERCMRVYPHLQDTGGFFITVLEKRAEIKRLRDPPTKRNAPPEETTASEAPVPEPASNSSVVQETNGQPMDIDGPSEEPAKERHSAASEPEKPTEDASNPAAAAPTEAVVVVDNNTLKPVIDSETASTSRSPKRPLEEEEDNTVDADEQASKRLRTEDDTSSATATAAAATPSAATPQPRSDSNNNNNKRNGQPHEEPFKYLDPNHEELVKIYDFYGISPRFPRDRFMVRNASGIPVKAIYYTSAIASKILKLNEGSGIKFVHCGVKMFVKQDAQGQDICRWRIQSEGLPIIEHWVSDSRVVRLYKRTTLKKLLIEMFPRVAGDGWKDLGEIGERARDISMGCCVLRVEPSNDEENGFNERMVLPLWRSMSSFNLMLPKEERKAMLLRVYDDDSPLVDNQARDRQLREEAAAAAEAAAEAEAEAEVAEEAANEAEGAQDDDAEPAVVETDEITGAA